MKTRRSFYRYSILFIFLIINYAAESQDKKPIVKDITHELQVSETTTLDIDYSTDLPALSPTIDDHFEIFTWDKPLVKRIVTVEVVPINHSEALKFIEHLEFTELKETPVEVSIDLACGIRLIHAERKEWVVTMKDETEYKIGSYQLKFTIYVPEDIQLNLKSNHSKISLGRLTNKARINLRSAALKANSINELDLNARSSTIQVNGINDGVLKLWHCEMASENIGNIRIIETAHCNYDLGEVKDLKIVKSKEDEFIIKRVRNLESSSSVFTNFYISHLENRLEQAGENGDVIIDQLSSGFDDIRIDNTFSIIRIGLAENPGIVLDTHTSLTEIFLDRNFKATTLSPDEKLRNSDYSRKRYFIGSKDAKSNIRIDCKQCEIHVK